MNPFHQFLSFFGLLDKTFGQQVHACYSLPEWQAVKPIYLRRKIYEMVFQWACLSMSIINCFLTSLTSKVHVDWINVIGSKTIQSL